MRAKPLPLWATNLKKFRTQYHYSQAAFGEKFGVTRMAVSYWESGQNEPPVEVLAWMLEASGMVDAGIFFKGGVEL